MFDNHLFSKDWKGRKENRKGYTRSKAFDTTCRNHGSCDYCRNNREFPGVKARDAAEKNLEDYIEE